MSKRPRTIVRMIRTRLVWLLMRSTPLERRIAWERRGRLAFFRWLVHRADVSILGGIGTRLRLDAASLSPSGAQSYPVLIGTHETQVQEALIRSVGPGGVVWDIGANIGYMSLIAARIVGAQGTVVALEPDPDCAAAIRRHAELNEMPNLHVVEAAAAARNETGELIVVADPLWSRLASVGEHDLATRRIDVRLIALDDLEAPTPDVIKIDVEGSELDVLAGMPRLLREARPVVICEMHGKNEAFCDAMEAAEYTVSNLDGPELVRVAGGNVHAICIPRCS